MNPRTEPTTKFETIDRILAADQALVPSSGFLASVMERVHEEAAAPAPIPFPWKRALPGMAVVAGVFGWCTFKLMCHAAPAAGQISLIQFHLPGAAAPLLAPAGWVAFALIVSMTSWLLSRRLAGRSGLL
jgi:hypothetical protein